MDNDSKPIIKAWNDFYDQKGLMFLPIGEVQKIRVAFFAGVDAGIDATKETNAVVPLGDSKPR